MSSKWWKIFGVVILVISVALFAVYFNAKAGQSFLNVNIIQKKCLRKCTEDVAEQNQKYDVSTFYHFQELSNYINGKLKKIESTYGDNKPINLREDINELKRIINSNIFDTKEFENENYWRKEKLSEFTKIIQTRIHNSQFPLDCNETKKLNCQIHRGCGIGCQLHFIAYCLIVGYSTNRTVLPVLENWVQHNFGSPPVSYFNLSWYDLFLPITNCSDPLKSKRPIKEDILTVSSYDVNITTLPQAFPEEFQESLLLHPYPPIFWIGQFMNFTMRFTRWLQKQINEKIKNIKFMNPIVGIHVRRTDKLSYEAQAFQIEEYMTHVSNWYDSHKCQNCAGNKKGRVYIETDEPDVINETLSKYPDYEFVYDYHAAVRAKFGRIQASSLIDSITMVHLLSRCDFIVCTFSSNVGRLAFELLQVLKNGDFTESVISLDANYFFFGQQPSQKVVILDHVPQLLEPDEIELKEGDILILKDMSKTTKIRNEFDGYSIGQNVRTGKTGKFPSYKVKDKWIIERFPPHTRDVG